MNAPQPNEGNVDHGEVQRRAATNEKPVGPQSSLMKPMNLIMGAAVVIILLWAIFGSGWLL
jgi:hypothetical protein